MPQRRKAAERRWNARAEGLYSAPMALKTFTLLLALAIVCAPAGPMARQDVAPLTDAAMEQFLRTARVLRTRDTAKGVTGSVRATLSDGTLTHDAHIQVIDVAKAQFRGKGGVVENDFRDNWRFNIAVYRIDRLLGLQLVPVSVQRTWKGQRAAFTWWVDEVLMDEGERMKNNVEPPDLQCWDEQRHLVRLLDQLIDNVDRNLGNMLITKNWRVWAIDHTRAFRYSRTPRIPAYLTGVDRTVLQRLEALDFAGLKTAIDRHINDADIRTLLSRRDGIVAHFKARTSAIFDRQDHASGCLR
jgi:hypothetical protein